MTYTPRMIKDRVADGDDIFKKEDLPGGRFRLIPDPDNVYEAGTDVNKVLMQPWEDIHAAAAGSDEVQLRMLWNGRVVRVTNKGNYSATAVYNKYDYVVSAQGNGFFAQGDNLSGATPPATADGSNEDWRPFRW